MPIFSAWNLIIYENDIEIVYGLGTDMEMLGKLIEMGILNFSILEHMVEQP